jgi:hypothetical protein
MNLSTKQKLHLFLIGCISGAVAISAITFLNAVLTGVKVKVGLGGIKDISASIVVPLCIWFWGVMNRGGTDPRYLSSFRPGFVLGALVTSFYALSNNVSPPDVSVCEKLLKIIGASALAGVVYHLLMGKHSDHK